jgi:Flp pilus assembly protein TadG
MRKLAKFTKLAKDRRGSIGLIMGLTLPLILAVGGSAVDFGFWQAQRSALQNLADRAALAGASSFVQYSYGSNADQVAAAAVARQIAAERPDLTPVVETSSVNKSVKVTVKEAAKTYFTGLLGMQPFMLGATGSATMAKGPGSLCMLALDPNANVGVSFGGSAKFTAPTCKVWSNAGGGRSIVAAGNVVVDAMLLCAAGQVIISGNSAQYTGATSNGCEPQLDPLLDWTAPSSAGCTFNNVSLNRSTDIELAPGVYCGGLTATSKQSIKLLPGVYVIKNGGLKLTADASITGDGVGIFLTGNKSTADISGQARVSLKADGDKASAMCGIVLASDRGQNTNNLVSKINGGASVDFVGTIYLPTQQLSFVGNSLNEGSSPLNQIIAKTIDLAGTTEVKFKADFDTANLPKITSFLPTVRLVN